ncbi:hypothetical protein ACVWZ4_000330 [Bradyrhizobium sp. USDA 4472]
MRSWDAWFTASLVWVLLLLAMVIWIAAAV